MKYYYLLLFILLTFANANAQLPTSNPYLDKYDTCPAWTNELQWENIIDITSYDDSPAYWDSAVSLAMLELNSEGGGVIYFPAGTYNFKNNVTLLSGIVLRGVKPACNDARRDSFAPPSRLVFPKYEPVFSGSGTPNSTSFKVISSNFSTSENIGLVYLDINRGRISLSAMKNLMVFGVRQNNIACPQSDIPGSYPMMHGWQRFCNRFCRNVSVYVGTNTTVANNRINDFDSNVVHPVPNESYEQPGYIAYGSYKGTRTVPTGASYTETDTNLLGQVIDTTHIEHGERAMFSYTDHYGMGVSGMYINPDTIDAQHAVKVIPDQKIEVRDNWLLNTMRVGYFVQGYGLNFIGNVRRDLVGKRVFLRPEGIRLQSSNSATYENRSLNFAGYNIRIEDNNMLVYRHNILYSGYLSVDGEGILMQTQDIWGSFMDGIYIRGNKINAYIGLYDLKFDQRNIYVENNDLMNGGYIHIFQKEAVYRLDDYYIRGNTNVTWISVGYKITSTEYQAVGRNIFIENNQGAGNINHPCQAIVQNNTGFTYPMLCSSTFSDMFYIPYYGQRQVSVYQKVKIVFSEELASGTMTGITITGKFNGAVTGIIPQISKDTLIIYHDPLFDNDEYTVYVPANVVKGKTSSINNAEITTKFITDSKPAVLSTFPADSSKGVSLNASISIQFDQEVDEVNFSGITLRDYLGADVTGVALLWDDEDNVLYVAHDDFVYEYNYYTLTIPASAVINKSGLYNDSYSFSFMTDSNAVGPISPLVRVVSPEATDEEYTVAVYPNPVSDGVTIEHVYNDAPMNIKIVDIKGNQVYHSISDKGSVYIPFSGFTKGIYFILVDNKTFKVIYW